MQGVENIKTSVMEFVKRSRGGVTFAELQKAGIKNWCGDQSIFLAEHEKCANVLLWGKVSSDAVEAIGQLLAERKLQLAPTNVLTYMCDGEVLNLPLAKSARRYKSPRWCPVVLNLA